MSQTEREEIYLSLTEILSDIEERLPDSDKKLALMALKSIESLFKE